MEWKEALNETPESFWEHLLYSNSRRKKVQNPETPEILGTFAILKFQKKEGTNQMK